MSTTVTRKTAGLVGFDCDVADAACTRLGLAHRRAAAGRKITTKLHDRSVEGVYEFHLPGWEFPVAVVDAEAGKVAHDDYKAWRNPEHPIDWFAQHYLAERAILSAAQEGLRLQSMEEVQGELVLQLCE